MTGYKPNTHPAWKAYYAFVGYEPTEAVVEYLELARAMYASESVGEFEFLPGGRDWFEADLQLVLIAMTDALKPDGTSDMKLTISRRAAGNPPDKLGASRRGHAAARIVEERVASGEKKEAAVQFAKEQTGLSRTEIWKWLRHRKNLDLLSHRPANSGN